MKLMWQWTRGYPLWIRMRLMRMLIARAWALGPRWPTEDDAWVVGSIFAYSFCVVTAEIDARYKRQRD